MKQIVKYTSGESLGDDVARTHSHPPKTNGSLGGVITVAFGGLLGGGFRGAAHGLSL